MSFGQVGYIAQAQADIPTFQGAIRLTAKNADGQHGYPMSPRVIDDDCGRPEAHRLLIQDRAQISRHVVMLEVGRLVDDDRESSGMTLGE